MAKTFIGKLLAGIVAFFGSIFSHVIEGAEKTFDELPEAQKEALKHGSGIMEIFKSMLDKTPDEIRAAIKDAFPDIDEEALEAGLFTIAHAFNLAPEVGNLNDCIEKLKQHLKSATDNNVWDGILHTASLLLSVILAPEGTAFGAIAQLIEYVYRKYIKD